MADTPTLDELAGQKSDQIPTLDELANSDPDKGAFSTLKDLADDFLIKGPYSGQVADYLFSPVFSAGRILKAFGAGIAEGWESGKSPEEQILDKETQDRQNNIAKSASESWLRPSAAALAHLGTKVLDFPGKVIYAGLGGVSEATGQLGHELKTSPQAQILPAWNPIQGLSELVEGFSSGAGMDVLPEIAEHVENLNKLRAKAVIGEGEEGYYGTQPPTKGELQGREEAAREANLRLGINNKILPRLPEETVPAIPDVDDLARQISPDTFKEWDRLTGIQDNLRATKQYLEGRIEGPEGKPENQKIFGKIRDVRDRLQTIDTQLRDLIPSTSQARNRVQEFLASDSQEGEQYRDYVQAQALENAIRLQELSPDVSDAYKHARTLLTDPPKEKQPEGASQKASQPGIVRRPTQGIADTTTGPGALPGPSETKPSPDDVSQISATEIEKALRENYSGSKEFTSLSWKDESDKAKALVDKDPEQAKRIALGQEVSPGVHPQAVLAAVKQLAYKTDDFDLVDKLSTSPLEAQGKFLGQGLGMRRGIHQFDPVSLLNEINESMKSVVRKADKKIDKLSGSLEDRLAKFDLNWQEFVRDIQCPE